MNVSFDAEKKKVTKVEVTEQKETEGLGAKVADAEFLSQFEGVEAPVFLPGMSLEKEEKVSDEELLKELKDGTYEAKADAPDNNGFTDVVTVTVKAVSYTHLHAIMHESGLTFLGFGLSPEQPAIGIILSESMKYISAGMWWLAFFPGLMLVIIVLLFDRLGENLKKIIDPYSAHE